MEHVLLFGLGASPSLNEDQKQLMLFQTYPVELKLDMAEKVLFASRYHKQHYICLNKTELPSIS
jgi:hypothetical protein